MSLHASKIFGKFTNVFPKGTGGYDGIFNDESAQICCSQQKRSIFSGKELPGESKGDGNAGIFNLNCCDDTKEDISNKGGYPEKPVEEER